MFTPPSPPKKDTVVTELIRFSVRSAALKNDTPRSLDAHAPPLSPLRERDLRALDAWFDREDIDEITNEVDCVLRWLWPEPCWDEEPFEFLRDYL
jgi:hypothetical protein